MVLVTAGCYYDISKAVCCLSQALESSAAEGNNIGCALALIGEAAIVSGYLYLCHTTKGNVIARDDYVEVLLDALVNGKLDRLAVSVVSLTLNDNLGSLGIVGI